MPTTSPLHRMLPSGPDATDPGQWFLRFDLSHPGRVTVSSRTEANTLLTDYNTACDNAQPPVPRQPLTVWNEATQNEERHANVSGADWEYVAGRQYGAVVNLGRPGANALDGVEDNVVTTLMVTGFGGATSPGWTLYDDATLVFPASGWYTLSAHVAVSGAATTLGRAFFEYIIGGGTTSAGRTPAPNEDVFTATRHRHFNKGEFLKMRYYHQTGGTREVNAQVDIALTTPDRL